jgi:integrase/recombinase XerC
MLEMEMKHFLTYCKISEFTEKSIEALTTRLNEFKEYLETAPIRSAKEISYRHLREYVAEFKDPSVHIKKGRVWTLHQFFHFLTLNGLVRENIARDIPYPKIEKTIPHFLTIDEYNRILQYFFKKAIDFFGLRNLALIMMLGLLGLRLGSILSLNIEDIDLETGLIWFADKGRKERTLVLPEILCIVFSEYLQLHERRPGPLFLSKRKKRISLRTLQIIFKQAADELGIEKHLHAHLFRHTAATHMNRVAGPVITQHVLGHMYRKNTEKYTHLNPDQYAVYMKRHPYMKGDIK